MQGRGDVSGERRCGKGAGGAEEVSSVRGVVGSGTEG
jgi:hypothetical protein